MWDLTESWVDSNVPFTLTCAAEEWREKYVNNLDFLTAVVSGGIMKKKINLRTNKKNKKQNPKKLNNGFGQQMSGQSGSSD